MDTPPSYEQGSRSLPVATEPQYSSLASTTIAVVFNANVDRVIEITAELLRLLLGKCIPGNYYEKDCCQRSCSIIGTSGLTFKRLINVDSLLRTGLEVRDIALGLAERHGSLVRDLSLILSSAACATLESLSCNLPHACYPRRRSCCLRRPDDPVSRGHGTVSATVEDHSRKGSS